MLSREERILTELLITRGLVRSGVVEECVQQLRDSTPRLRLVDALISSCDLDQETGRRLAEEAREIDSAMAPELAQGDRLGEFTLIREIGRGGMGVVYEAEQESLGRRVALKVLPVAAARDERLVLRFLREARAVGRLHHPGIVTVYGSGNAQGVLYFAMELISGRTLAQIIGSGTVSPETAARMALDLARALSHAHDADLVHRDVKPENILVGPDGHARIADFGLVHEAQAGGVSLSHCMLGTPAYMPPEQARGEPADARWDVYGLGAVLYAMLTGHAPYTGDVPAAVLARLLTEDPEPISSRNPAVPAQLADICGKAMARDPRFRYGSAADLAGDLERFLGGETVSVRSPRRSRVAWATALVGIAALAGAGWLMRAAFEAEASPAPFPAGGERVNRYRRLSLPPGLKSWPALSPDGRRLAYASAVGGNWSIYVAQTGDSMTINLTAGLQGQHSQPAFSPDGRRLAFVSRRTPEEETRNHSAEVLYVVDLDDHEFRLVGRGAQPAWSPDGREIAVVDRSGPREVGPVMDQSLRSLRVIDAESGTSRLLTSVGAAQPAWSPGGQRIAFVSATAGEWNLWTVAAAGGELVRVTLDAARDWSPVWAPDGHHLFFGSERGGGLDVWKVPIDEATGETRGEPRQVSTGFATGLFYLSGDRHGNLALLHNDGLETIFALPLDAGSATALGTASNYLGDVLRRERLAEAGPQGRYLAYTTMTRAGDALYLLDLATREAVALFQERFPLVSVRWSPSGDRIALQIEGEGGAEIRILDTHGARRGNAVVLQGAAPTWSPDGQFLAYAGPGGHARVVPMDAPETPADTLPPFPEVGVSFAPESWSADGEHLAGTAGGIVVYDFRQQQYRRLVDRGERPIWVGRSTRLLFVDGDRIRTVDSATGETRDVRSVEPNRLIPFLSLSPDAGLLYYSAAGSDEEIYILETDTAAPKPSPRSAGAPAPL